MATGLAFRAMSATTRLRRGSIRSSRPPEVDAPVDDLPQQATQTVSAAALTEMDPLSGPPSEIFEVALSVAGSMPQRAPGTATGTQTAPAPTATPAGPAPVAATGMVATTLLVAGSMRVTCSLPATQRAPAPVAMLEGISPVPMVATTGEARPGTATPASRRASARTAATQRRLGATRRRVPAGATAPSDGTASRTAGAACPSPSACSGGAPTPPGSTRRGGAEAPPGSTRRGRGGQSGRTTPPDPP